jgi:hypothetical protein
MNGLRHFTLCALAGLAASIACQPSTSYAQATLAIPQTEATALSGQVIRLPQDLPPHAVLILGFSEKSSSDTAACGKRLGEALAKQLEVKVYQIPVLEEVPRLVRGFVTRSMKKSVPAPVQSTFIPVFDHETEWKRLSGFAAPDDAYILIAGHQGQILWRTHGPCSADKVREVTSALDKAN